MDHSPSEEEWFDRLASGFPTTRLERWGVTWLNLEFGRREYLRRFVEGESYELLQRAREFNREQEVIGSIADAVRRIELLSARAQELSPYWKADFTATAEGTRVVYRERFPGAAQLDPVQLHCAVDFASSDACAAKVQRQLTDVLPTRRLRFTSVNDPPVEPISCQLVLVSGAGDPKFRLALHNSAPTVGMNRPGADHPVTWVCPR